MATINFNKHFKFEELLPVFLAFFRPNNNRLLFLYTRVYGTTMG
jgi:hypothetical protein